MQMKTLNKANLSNQSNLQSALFEEAELHSLDERHKKKKGNRLLIILEKETSFSLLVCCLNNGE